ncbi:MAG: hypothetical protein P1Q69_04550 [Candidatus Thorarchaeota archaeon]|nr:hypothetical protein [Candidatus Thorarchaeota archaeon]
MTKVRSIFLTVFLIFSFAAIPITPVEATSWTSWTSAAVGDVYFYQLEDYWSFTSTPVSGYGGNLWSNWGDVITCALDHNSNNDKEIIFGTYGSSSYMGYLTIESNYKIEGADLLHFRGHYGWKFSYAGVRTLGSIEIYDLTTGLTVWDETIVSDGTTNTWKWKSFYSPPEISVSTSHDYVIRLKAKDVWSSQKVEIAFEAAEPWFFAPHFVSFYESSSTQTTCKWKTYFGFKQGAIDDMIREHRPYVKHDGFPFGWNPCYIKEFRSDPWTILEANSWYSTNLPGTVGYTESNEDEEESDEYEEIEVYTLNPEYLSAGTVYYIEVGYDIVGSGTVIMSLESELANEADWIGVFDPPGFAVGWLEIDEDTETYSLGNFYLSSDTISSEGAINVKESFPIECSYMNDWYSISIVGMYPYNLRINENLHHNATRQIDNYKSLMDSMTRQLTSASDSNTKIPVTVTLDRPLDTLAFNSFIQKYGLDLEYFRFSARNGSDIIQGQGVPNSSDEIPIRILEGYIDGCDFNGIHSFDAYISLSNLRMLSVSNDVAIIDTAVYHVLSSLGLDVSDFFEVTWFKQDVAWVWNNGFQ